MDLLLEISGHIRLELTAPHHSEGLLHAVNENRLHLSRFLPWVPAMQTVQDFNNYIANCQALYGHQKEASFVIFFNNTVVGRIGLHYIDMANKTAAIGYWLSKSAEGKGIITQCCKAIINYGFTQLNLHRIEIKAANQNLRSLAIPQKLGFVKEGILRQSEWVNGQPLDIVLYAMLKQDWL